MSSPSKFGSFEAAMARNSLDTVVHNTRRKFQALSLSLTQALARPSVTEYESGLFKKTYHNIFNELESLLVENRSDPALVEVKDELKTLHARLAQLKVAETTPFQRMKAKVHSLCTTSAQSSKDLLTVLESSSSNDPFTLTRAFEGAHRKLAHLQDLQRHILAAGESEDSLSTSQVKELCADLARHIQNLSQTLIKLVISSSHLPDSSPLLHFEFPSEPAVPLRCSVCDDTLGNLCEKCSPSFDQHMELLALNSHGLAHTAQISEIIKTQNEELVSKRAELRYPRDQRRLEVDSLSHSKKSLEDEGQKRKAEISSAGKRILEVKAQIAQVRKQNDLVRNRVLGQEMELGDIEQRVASQKSKLDKGRDKKAARMMRMAGIEPDPFDPKLILVLGFNLPRNFSTLRNNMTPEQTSALSTLILVADGLSKLYSVPLPHRITFNWAQSQVLPSVLETPPDTLSTSTSSNLLNKALSILPGTAAKPQPVEPSLPLLEAIEQNIRFVASLALSDLAEHSILESPVGDLLIAIRTRHGDDPLSTLATSTSTSHTEEDVDFVVLPDGK